jgi:hypothetical protein
VGRPAPRGRQSGQGQACPLSKLLNILFTAEFRIIRCLRPSTRTRGCHTSATSPDPGRPKTAYVREDQILPHLAAIAILLAGPAGKPGRRNRGLLQVTGPADTAALIDQLRADDVVLAYDPGDRTLRAGDAPSVTIGRDATDVRPRRNNERRTA